MKKQTIILAVTLLIAVVSTTSCSKKCHGGGWYGDRNLGYAPIKKQAQDAPLKLEEDIENCNTAEP